VAFIVEAFSHYVVGWQASRSLHRSRHDDLEMAISASRGVEQRVGLSRMSVQPWDVDATERATSISKDVHHPTG
jgi:hypothetical protein